LLVEVQRAFGHLLLLLLLLRLRQLAGVSEVLLQAGYRLPGQSGVVAKVAIGDQLALGM
jgi:hypothetical protein